MGKLLPIGTVVRLTDGSKKLMVTGYYSKVPNENKIYTYNACVFPEGFMENTFCLFDANQIAEVLYLGLENDDFNQYLQKLDPNVATSLSVNSNNDSGALVNKKSGRVPKAPTNPLSLSEMHAKFTVSKISGGCDTTVSDDGFNGSL